MSADLDVNLFAPDEDGDETDIGDFVDKNDLNITSKVFY